MTIHELLQVAGLTASDEIPIWDAEATGEPTKKITATNMALSMMVLSSQQVTPASAFSIPAPGSSVSYNMPGLTANHVLTQWNFSSSPENVSQVSLRWNTYNGYFTITNTDGTTSETIKPVFELPTSITITAR